MWESVSPDFTVWVFAEDALVDEEFDELEDEDELEEDPDSFSLSPGKIVVDFKSLRLSRRDSDRSCLAAMWESVSPDFTVYVLAEEFVRAVATLVVGASDSGKAEAKRSEGIR